MPTKRFVKVVPFVFALGVSSAVAAVAAPASQAAGVHATAMMQVKKTGTFEKLLSATSFRMSVDMRSFVVKTNAMTHVTLGTKKVGLSALKKGDTVTVKGELEMGSIVATSVDAAM